MTFLDSVSTNVDRVTSNKGHVRLFKLVAIGWIVVATWFVWAPLPKAETYYLFGQIYTRGCTTQVLDSEECVARKNREAAGKALALRGAVVFSLPVLLPVLAILGLAAFEWIKDGYRKKPTP